MKTVFRVCPGSIASLCAAALLSVASVSMAQSDPSHIVVVMLENHGYSQLLSAGTSGAPFINGTLRPESADMTQAWGIQHPSQPNYYWLFSGGNQGITTDTAPTAPVYSAPNLYTMLSAAGESFAGYIDAYPGANALYQDTDNYVTRHVAWLGFTNVPANVSQDFATSPFVTGDYSQLPSVSFVIPGLDNDMHDYDSTGDEVENETESEEAIANSDQWLQQYIAPYVEWAKANNSLLILTTDEDSTADWVTPPLTGQNVDGYTSPDSGPGGTAPTGPNQITTLIAGANVVAGTYDEGAGISNLTVFNTIENLEGLTVTGSQDSLLAAAGLSNAPITDIFAVPEPPVTALIGLALGVVAVGAIRRRARA